MKKVFIMAIAALGFTFGAQAQEGLSAGINLGLPVGDAGDVSGFNVGADFSYLSEISDDFLAGGTIGYSHFFGKKITEGSIEIEFDDIMFLPIAASGKYMVSEDFSIGADLGYALGLKDGVDGGFYYRPRVAHKIADTIELNLSYSGISVDNGTWSTLNLGVMFQL